MKKIKSQYHQPRHYRYPYLAEICSEYIIDVVKTHPGKYNEWELIGRLKAHLARRGEENIGIKMAALVFEEAIKTGEITLKGMGNISVSKTCHYYPSRDPYSERQNLLRRREERIQNIDTY